MGDWVSSIIRNIEEPKQLWVLITNTKPRLLKKWIKSIHTLMLLIQMKKVKFQISSNQILNHQNSLETVKLAKHKENHHKPILIHTTNVSNKTMEWEKVHLSLLKVDLVEAFKMMSLCYRIRVSMRRCMIAYLYLLIGKRRWRSRGWRASLTWILRYLKTWKVKEIRFKKRSIRLKR